MAQLHAYFLKVCESRLSPISLIALQDLKKAGVHPRLGNSAVTKNMDKMGELVTPRWDGQLTFQVASGQATWHQGPGSLHWQSCNGDHRNFIFDVKNPPKIFGIGNKIPLISIA